MTARPIIRRERLYGLTIESKRAGAAVVRKGRRAVGRVTRLPNGWQAWKLYRDRPAECIGWGARRRDAAALFAPRRPPGWRGRAEPAKEAHRK